MTSDVPLSREGSVRAKILQDLLKDEGIEAVYSTNTMRTKSTVKPTADHFNLPILIYGPMPDAAFISSLTDSARTVLVVGHSNTVDDIVNGILGENRLSDLPESSYDNLFVLVRRNGAWELETRKFGKTTD